MTAKNDRQTTHWGDGTECCGAPHRASEKLTHTALIASLEMWAQVAEERQPNSAMAFAIRAAALAIEELERERDALGIECVILSARAEAANNLHNRAEAERDALRKALWNVRDPVCSSLCPSVKSDTKPWPHVAECTAITDVLGAPAFWDRIPAQQTPEASDE